MKGMSVALKSGLKITYHERAGAVLTDRGAAILKIMEDERK